MNDDTTTTNLPPQDPNTVARICLITSATALTAAACFGAVGYFFTGGMAAAGMAAVGLFYLALGLMNWQPEDVGAEDRTKTNIHSDEVHPSAPFDAFEPVAKRHKPHRKNVKSNLAASKSAITS